MIAKPAMLECTRCGKIFIGWKTDGRPKSAPMCLKCQTRRAWEGLTSAIGPEKGGAGGKRKPARKSAKRSEARKTAAKPGVAKAAKRRTVKAKRSR